MISAPILIGVVKRRVEPGSRVVTDQLRAYTGLREDFDHDVINHIKEFGRGDIHTNTIENLWSLLNRGIVGSFHKVSIKHFDRYLAEFTYRFNRRDQQGQLFAETTKNLLRGKALTYDKLTSLTVSGF
jgi:transposase-like protein